MDLHSSLPFSCPNPTSLSLSLSLSVFSFSLYQSTALSVLASTTSATKNLKSLFFKPPSALSSKTLFPIVQQIIIAMKQEDQKTVHLSADMNPPPPPTNKPSATWQVGPIIVGAGPSGLAVAACLSSLGIPSTVLERDACIASLWQHCTYDRLKLHLPKSFCELPLMGFPENFPKYPTKDQFVSYMKQYANKFGIEPRFCTEVVQVHYDESIEGWRVCLSNGDELASKWVVVATGENAEPVVPEIKGLDLFEGRVIHTCRYKSGKAFEGEKVLVVGCGNSGMEVSLDLCWHNASPSMVVRNTVRKKNF